MSCIIQELTEKVKKWSQCPMLAHHHHLNHITVFVPVRHLCIHIHTNLPPHATYSLTASELDSMFLHRTEPERMSWRAQALIEWNLTGRSGWHTVKTIVLYCMEITHTALDISALVGRHLWEFFDEIQMSPVIIDPVCCVSQWALLWHLLSSLKQSLREACTHILAPNSFTVKPMCEDAAVHYLNICECCDINFTKHRSFLKLLYTLFSYQTKSFFSTVITVIECLVSNPCLSSPCLCKTRYFLVSLPTLSNQDRELHKEAILSAQVTGRERHPPVLVATLVMAWHVKLPIPALWVTTYVGQVMNTLAKRQRQRGLPWRKEARSWAGVVAYEGGKGHLLTVKWMERTLKWHKQQL